MNFKIISSIVNMTKYINKLDNIFKFKIYYFIVNILKLQDYLTRF